MRTFRIMVPNSASFQRLYSQTTEERSIYDKIKKALEPSELKVKDMSGGCGSMFSIEIKSSKFNGLSKIKQHKLVNELLREDIARWHGLSLKTKKDAR